MAARILSGSRFLKGTSSATGLPCFVITKRSPFRTRSSNRGGCVLALEAPISNTFESLNIADQARTHETAGETSSSIIRPIAFPTTETSYALCRFIQNAGPVLRKRNSCQHQSSRDSATFAIVCRLSRYVPLSETPNASEVARRSFATKV